MPISARRSRNTWGSRRGRTAPPSTGTSPPMPELPEVETVRRGLQPVLEGARIVKVEARRPDLRFPFPDRFVETLTGRRVTALGRRAKYLTMHLEGGAVLICHLGMSGSFRVEAGGASATPGIFHHERSKLKAH